jgi:predicted Rossmann fold flavoprotein
VNDVIILGAGASGLMAAIHAAQRGRRVLVIDHAERVGKKLLVSGGGKCNITNKRIVSADYFGADNSFCTYALQRFTTESVRSMLQKAKIETEEREHGRIFCKKSANEIVSYLLQTAQKAGVQFLLNTDITEVMFTTTFHVKTKKMSYASPRLLVATGGLARPSLGASHLGYSIAKQFGHTIKPLKPALTGLTLPSDSPLLNLQGISLDVQLWIKGKGNRIEEPLLFTHKGISGPSVLQVTCFWEKGDAVLINFLPSEDIILQMHHPSNGKQFVKNLMSQFLPERFVRSLLPESLSIRKVAELSKKDRQRIGAMIHSFPVLPDAVEGYSKAEATSGGVSTHEIHPESMESLLQKGLFFSGEVIDITGKLGGYNIHWAFASGYLAGGKIYK